MKALLLILMVTLLSCGKTTKKSSLERQNVSPIYSSSRINIKVFYEQGAEPYTEGALGVSLWNVFENNIKSLFQGKSTVFDIPKTLTDMHKLSSPAKSTWSAEDVLKLSKSYSATDPAGTTTFNIFFLNGRAKENANIIGFHISNTKVMAIFKDVIKSSGTTLVSRYVEQATIIHEMGHALGLVNNGLPMTKAHQDTSHGAHCSNENCVMYYSNEGTTSMMKFAQTLMANKDAVMFDEQCLDDARNFQK